MNQPSIPSDDVTTMRIGLDRCSITEWCMGCVGAAIGNDFISRRRRGWLVGRFGGGGGLQWFDFNIVVVDVVVYAPSSSCECVTTNQYQLIMWALSACACTLRACVFINFDPIRIIDKVHTGNSSSTHTTSDCNDVMYACDQTPKPKHDCACTARNASKRVMFDFQLINTRASIACGNCVGDNYASIISSLAGEWPTKGIWVQSNSIGISKWNDFTYYTPQQIGTSREDWRATNILNDPPATSVTKWF